MLETDIKHPMNDLEQFRETYDTHLKSFLDEKVSSIHKYSDNPTITEYVNHAKEIILGPGKRIRPYISYLMYKSSGGNEDEKAMKLLVSSELFHSFCMVHDDIIDNGNLRHGVETVNSYVSKKMEDEERIGDPKHIGNAQAILVGDLLFSWSNEILNTNDDFDHNTKNKIRTLFGEMAEETAVGQMLDVDITTKAKASKKDIEEKTRLKTAGYSFIKPLQIGAILAGDDSKETENFCEEFGMQLGTAFQIQDDLLDIIFDERDLEKTPSDQSNNQHTVFSDSASLEPGKKLIEEKFKKAKKLLTDFPIEKPIFKRKLMDLISLIENRKK